ncbi:hypothetical protein EC973_005910 [Apophysomyces ossiformis]|uniref:Uncharacterized protein n=1 Tax=Apophysomyces ossiformis TaxID=679940 RepID=A0A8H7EP81_9FUNG|nr:hypothetical protein EC973_005910 [Apophysomyces ossiformis]
MNYSNLPRCKPEGVAAKRDQACLFFQSIEINQRQRLNPRCIAYLAQFVASLTEENPPPEKMQRLKCLMDDLLDTTAIKQPTFADALTEFCNNCACTPTICPSRHGFLKGSAGCETRLIVIAYITAAKVLQHYLRMIIRSPTSEIISPNLNASSQVSEQSLRIMRMEMEFLRLIGYDVSVQNPMHLVHWAHSFSETISTDDEYTSADEGGDELDDSEDDVDYDV